MRDVEWKYDFKEKRELHDVKLPTVKDCVLSNEWLQVAVTQCLVLKSLMELFHFVFFYP